MSKPNAYIPLMGKARRSLIQLGDCFNDEKMSQYSVINRLSIILDRPPSVLTHSIILLLLSVLLLNPFHLSGVSLNAVTMVWLGWMTVSYFSAEEKAVVASKSKSQKSTKKWPDDAKKLVDCWVLYSASVFIESTFGEETLLTIVPLYWAFKGIAIIRTMMVLYDKKERMKPKPLKLKPRPKNTRNILSSSPSPAQLPEGTSKTSYADDESSSQGDTAVDSVPTPSSSQLRQMRQQLEKTTPPPLSRTPDNIRDMLPNPDKTPGSSNSSEPFGLSGNLDHSKDSESDSADLKHSSESDNSASTSGSGSAHLLDDAEDVFIPPGTPLDDLALRGIRSKFMPEVKEYELSEEAKKLDESNMRYLRGHLSEKEEELEIRLGEDMGRSPATEALPSVMSSAQDSSPNPPKSSPSPYPPINATTIIPSLPAHSANPNSQPGSTHVPGQIMTSSRPNPLVPTTANPLSANPVAADEGSITRLTLDDLLAMEHEADSGPESAGSVGLAGGIKKTIGNENVPAVEPLKSRKPQV
ncbi:hypothetical protein L204_102692 [Cryptococcus depauperatus]|nr:hypothetical protein L204_00557 [Cryptococcus depauperatus CBS 7855]